MYKIGVFVGKMLPPTRGHLHAIIQASTKCDKLYVVVSHHPYHDEICKNSGIKPMPLKLRAKWLSQELSDFDHIEVRMLDETGIPSYPNGWNLWTERLKQAVGCEFDVIFGGETEYTENYKKYFPNTEYIIFDKDRESFPISATMVRENPYKYWEYIVGSARPFFAKRILLAGTESCGKSSLTKMLAKIFYTSWAREEGRYYSEKYLGNNDDVFELEDFYKIALEHRELEDLAIKAANKIVFIDTDATVTQYYCDKFMGEFNHKIESVIDPNRYDVILFMKPDVKWVNDGTRFLSEQSLRERLHEELKQMYIERGFGDKIIEIGGSYNERLNAALDICNNLINK